MSKATVMLAAGGTGGHLFPAYALAEELARRNYGVDLVTDMRGDRYGTGFPAQNIYRIPAGTIAGRSPVALAKFGLTLLRGLFQATRILARVKPAAVVGFGGYPSFAPVLAASHRRIPTVLHEQNAVLGRANRALATRVDAIATSFEHVSLLEGQAKAKAHFVGNPVRQLVIDHADVPYEPAGENDPFRLVVFGGSQGARFFSDIVPPAIAKLPPPCRNRLKIVQQCREEDLDRVRAIYQANAIDAQLASFFNNLPELMSQAHLVIARSGASTVAELTVLGRPSLLVPLPGAIDNDQLRNAAQLAESGGACCIPESELSPDRLASELEAWLDNPEMLREAASHAKSLGRPQAVQAFADLVENTVRLRGTGS